MNDAAFYRADMGVAKYDAMDADSPEETVEDEPVTFADALNAWADARAHFIATGKDHDKALSTLDTLFAVRKAELAAAAAAGRFF